MRPPRVLVADDQPLNLELARATLEAGGFEVDLAHSGRQALDLVRLLKPDLVLLDIQMPDIDGLEVARRLKADPGTASIPLIAFTAYAMSGDETRFRAAGCDGYISKPIEVARLALQLRAFLR